MNRIERTFQSLDRSALVTFITAGDPDYATSLEILKTLPKAGADIIELGMPFTDPMADGPVIQAAANRALKAGASMKTTLEMVQDFRADNDHTPIVLMGYANPVYAYGLEAFAREAAQAGVDGLIIVDRPPEEAAELETLCQKNTLDLIRLVTPTTDEERLGKILKGAGGFLYYVSITGITGAASANYEALKPHIETIRKHTDLPVGIGFGIRTPQQAAEMAQIADAVVVGSALVKNIENTPYEDLPQKIAQDVQALSEALKSQKSQALS